RIWLGGDDSDLTSDNVEQYDGNSVMVTVTGEGETLAIAQFELSATDAPLYSAEIGPSVSEMKLLLEKALTTSDSNREHLQRELARLATIPTRETAHVRHYGVRFEPVSVNFDVPRNPLSLLLEEKEAVWSQSNLWDFE